MISNVQIFTSSQCQSVSASQTDSTQTKRKKVSDISVNSIVMLKHVIIVLIFSTRGRSQELQSNIHQSMLQYYQEMTETGLQSGLQTITSLPALVRSEAPCRVVFNLPNKYLTTKLSKVELHIQVLAAPSQDVSTDRAQAVLIVDTPTVRILAVKLQGDAGLHIVNVTRLITKGKPVKHLEMWIGYQRNERRIQCENLSAMRPTLFLHYTKSTNRFPRSLDSNKYLIKREIRSDDNKINGIVTPSSSSQSPAGCWKSSLSVVFSVLGWDRWIISPAGFSPGQCQGLCHSPPR